MGKFLSFVSKSPRFPRWGEGFLPVTNDTVGMVHAIRKAEKKLNAAVFKCFSDSYHFTFLGIDNESRVSIFNRWCCSAYFRLTLRSIHLSYDYHWIDGDQLSWTIRTKNLHVPEIDDPVRNKFHSQKLSCTHEQYHNYNWCCPGRPRNRSVFRDICWQRRSTSCYLRDSHVGKLQQGQKQSRPRRGMDVPTTSDSAQKAATLLYPELPVDEQYKSPMNPGYTGTGMCCWFYEV